jgi:hypothetical protein
MLNHVDKNKRNNLKAKSRIYHTVETIIVGGNGVLWNLTPLSTIFQLYHAGVLLVKETEYPVKTILKS